MKKVYLALLFAGVLSLTSACKKEKINEAADAQSASGRSEDAVAYHVNTGTSVIEWTGSKQTGKHSGTLKLKSGSIYVNDNAVEGGDFVIDMNTISVTDLKSGDGKEDLEGHLKGLAVEGADHFFNVTKYPEGKFEITKITTEAGKSTVEGNLTIKETTKNVSFPAMVNVNGDNVSIISDTFVIDRTQWKVNYGSKSVFQDLGDKFVNDEIELKVSVKASK